jgi:hypothetical protein
MAPDTCDLQKIKEARISNYVMIFEMDRMMVPAHPNGKRPKIAS